MANTEMWVGLDTNATAGRNEAMTNQISLDCDVIFQVHDCVCRIVARSGSEAKRRTSNIGIRIASSLLLDVGLRSLRAADQRNAA